MEEFSNYLISPMRKRYDLVFRSTAITFKAINCWLNLDLSDKAPRHWVKKRQAINERIVNLSRCPKKEAIIEEIDPNDPSESETQYVKTEEDLPKVATLGRLEINDRLGDIPAVIQYNILRKKDNIDIQQWKSYPGVSKIIDIARKVTERGDTSNIEELAGMPQVHESQQSATVIATIAVLVGNSLDNSTNKSSREAIGDVITWDTPLISEDDKWPARKKYRSRGMYSSNKDFSETKMIVHGYFGYKASKEIEQFLTIGELRRIAHHVDGVWIAPTRSTFKS